MRILRHKGEEYGPGDVRFLTPAEMAERKKRYRGHRRLEVDAEGNIRSQPRKPTDRFHEGGVVGHWTGATQVADSESATFERPPRARRLEPRVTQQRVVDDIVGWVLGSPDRDTAQIRLRFCRQWNPSAFSHLTDGQMLEALAAAAKAKVRRQTEAVYRQRGWDRGVLLAPPGVRPVAEPKKAAVTAEQLKVP